VTQFEVTWSMSYEANNPVDAARQAWDALMDPANTATVLKVEWPDPKSDSGQARMFLDMEDPDEPTMLGG
jgi:hypothetical protein